MKGRSRGETSLRPAIWSAKWKHKSNQSDLLLIALKFADSRCLEPWRFDVQTGALSDVAYMRY